MEGKIMKRQNERPYNLHPSADNIRIVRSQKRRLASYEITQVILIIDKC